MNPFLHSRSPSDRLFQRVRQVRRQVRRRVRPLTHHFTPDSRLERTGDWFRQQAGRVDLDKIGETFQHAGQTGTRAAREHPVSSGAAALAVIGAALGLYSLRRHEHSDGSTSDFDNEFHRVDETPEGQRPQASRPIDRFPLAIGILALATGVAAAVALRNHD